MFFIIQSLFLKKQKQSLHIHIQGTRTHPKYLPNYLPLLDMKGVNAKQIYLFELSLGKYLQIS